MDQERMIFNMLGDMWAKIYHAEKEIGVNHKLYMVLFELCLNINATEYEFLKYLRQEQDKDEKKFID